MINRKISVGEVKDLGGGKFSVRLQADGGEAVLSQTQTVAAESYDAAVQIAKEAFLRWLKKVEHVVKHADWSSQRSH